MSACVDAHIIVCVCARVRALINTYKIHFCFHLFLILRLSLFICRPVHRSSSTCLSLVIYLLNLSMNICISTLFIFFPRLFASKLFSERNPNFYSQSKVKKPFFTKLTLKSSISYKNTRPRKADKKGLLN